MGQTAAVQTAVGMPTGRGLPIHSVGGFRVVILNQPLGRQSSSKTGYSSSAAVTVLQLL